MRHPDPSVRFVFPKPGKAVLTAMVLVGCIWVMLAVAINYGGVSSSVILPFVGDASAILHGQIWRLFTAALIHLPSGEGAVGHIVTTLIGLYFLAPTLEDRWGAKRMALFLLGSAAFGFLCQTLVGLVVPKLAQPMFFGGIGVIEAVAIAWAVQNRHQQVQLFFVLPVTGTMLIAFVVGISVLRVIAQSGTPEGLVTPFGGMLAGWLLSDASPLRRPYLEWKLRRLKSQTAALRTAPAKRRAGGPSLRVIEGEAKPPKDRRFLN